MLVLSRRVGEEIVINDNIRVTIVAIKGDRIRLGIVAPREVTVDRAEVHQRRAQFLDGAAAPQSEDVPLGEMPVGEHSDETLIH
jgi:carbon storage regulator